MAGKASRPTARCRTARRPHRGPARAPRRPAAHRGPPPRRRRSRARARPRRAERRRSPAGRPAWPAGSRRRRAARLRRRRAASAPAASPSNSRPRIAVRPFIGSVAACSRLAPSGIGTTEAAGTTSSSCWAPPSGRRGLTTAITASPTREALAPPGRPTRSCPRRPCPGVHGRVQPAPAAAAQADVGRVDRGGADRDPDLAGARRRGLAVDDREDLGPSGLGDADGAHRREPSEPASRPGARPRPRRPRGRARCGPRAR